MLSITWADYLEGPVDTPELPLPGESPRESRHRMELELHAQHRLFLLSAR
jgi:hypothetical protein